MDNLKLKLGVFGTWRGLAYIRAVGSMEEAEITAICDKDPEKLQTAKKHCPPGVRICDSFEELLASGIDAVILCNYFHEHAPYAIKALQAGIHVLSETQAAVTIKECVELSEAVEASGCFYALAENYPYFRANREMARIYQSGQIGEVIFAEGEYIHPMSPQENSYYNLGPHHWRSRTPCTFYCTHAMAPLMTITGLMPKKVIGKVAAGWAYNEAVGSSIGDNYGIELVEMENGAVFRVGGCGAFGGHGNWYRLGCSKGGVESLRGSNDKVRLTINPWNLTEENRHFGTECVYTPELTKQGRMAEKFDHGGGDYWVIWSFVQDVLKGRQPYMDVYRSTAMAAIGILGWQSAICGSRELPYLVMMLIPTAYFLIFSYLPMFGLSMAFQNYKSGAPFLSVNTEWVGLFWFERLLSNPFFGRWVRNTLLLSLYNIVLAFPLSILMALLLNEIRVRWLRKLTANISLLPYFISTTVIVGIMVNFFSVDDGIFNALLVKLGGEKINFMGLSQWFRTMYTGSGIWQNTGFNAVVFTAAISSIDPMLYEAAKIDGSTRLKDILYITIPSIMPMIIIMLLLRIGSVMSVGYEKIILMYTPATYETADTLATYGYRAGILDGKMSLSAAIGFFNAVCNLALLLASNWFAKRVSETSLW